MLSNKICPRRRWGKTELSIPVIPFGTQGFGDNFGHVSIDESMELIRHAVDLGVNHFDCARCYGNSLSKLSTALKNGVIERHEIIISGRICHHSSAQWGFYGEGIPDYTAKNTLADTRSQLDLLGIEKFDVLFLHDPPEINPTLAKGGSLEGLETARQLGLVDFIGYGMNPHDSHMATIESGRIDALLCFSDYNLLRQSAADTILPAAEWHDLGVMNGWSIMRGWLTGKPVADFIPQKDWDTDQHRAEKIRLWCIEQDIELLDLAIQFCLQETRIHGNPIGSLNIAQLERNVEAACKSISDETFKQFLSAEF